MAELRVLRVFCDPQGNFGNPLGVFLNGHEVSLTARQEIAHQLGFSETVFLDSKITGALQIFTPAHELGLAGHPLVGTAWLAQQEGYGLAHLNPPAAQVAIWQQDGRSFIRAPIEAAPHWNFVQLSSVDEVANLHEPLDASHDSHVYWAWLDESAGFVRARVFASAHGVTQDEATGSAAMRMVSLLEREIVIHQGEGSIIFAKPSEHDNAFAEVGGYVVAIETREME